MSVQEFVRLLSEHSGWVLVGGIVLGTVAIKKLELPIWQWIVGLCLSTMKKNSMLSERSLAVS